MKTAIFLVAAIALAPVATAHGALELNKFDTYAISDFEGQEESFPWEGFEIWDIYAGDAYLMENESHAVYFKGNFAGDGTIRPTMSQTWDLEFTFTLNGTTYDRWISHDGTDVTTNFEKLDHQIADDNVFQMHGWVPIANWEGYAIQDLVVRSLVDGNLRDIAPGGIYDPVLGQEIPLNAPPTPVFPEIGEGRIVDEIPLSGAAKFLDVTPTTLSHGVTFNVTNLLATQGQHFMVHVKNPGNWAVSGVPNAESLDGAKSTAFTLHLTPNRNATVLPLQIDLMTDIGGLQSWYVSATPTGLQVAEAGASTFTPEPVAQEAPGLAALATMALLVVGAALRRRL